MSRDAKQIASETLRGQVLTLDLAPGMLVDETALAEQFGISRTPLREILQRLAGEGYFEIRAQRGAQVAPMDLATLRQFFQAAPMIYSAIARLAAENRTPAQIVELKSIQQAYRSALATRDARQSAMQNHLFHAAIGTMANSTYLLPSLERLLIDHTRIGQTFYRSTGEKDRARINQAADQHEAMIDAIETSKPGLAVELTLQHWALSRDRMEAFVTPAPLEFELEIRDAV